MAGGRPKGPPRLIRVTMGDLEYEMCHDVARMYDMPVRKWIRDTLRIEACRARVAASNVPQGLRPGAKVYRVLSAPVQGAWEVREMFVATGIERVWVTQVLSDVPEYVAKDHQGAIVDVLGGASNLLVSLANVRWIGNSVLEQKRETWGQKRVEGAT